MRDASTGADVAALCHKLAGQKLESDLAPCHHVNDDDDDNNNNRVMIITMPPWSEGQMGFT